MLSIPFTYDRQDCVRDLNQEKYASFRKWFFANYSKQEQQNYKTLFYNHIDCIGQLISFPLWFIDQATIDESPYLYVLKTFQKQWTTANGDTISAIHPPSEFLKIPAGDTIIESVAFSHEKQLNFTNLTWFLIT